MVNNFTPERRGVIIVAIEAEGWGNLCYIMLRIKILRVKLPSCVVVKVEPRIRNSHEWYVESPDRYIPPKRTLGLQKLFSSN